MADSKKYNGSTWGHSLRKLTTATEAVENPLYTDGTSITAYTISGNTVQDGTPAPTNPVDVVGVGNKTENLYDWNDGYVPLYPNETTGVITRSSGATYSIILPVKPSTTYAFSLVNETAGLRRRVGMCATYPQEGDVCLSVDSTTDSSGDRLGNIFTTTSETNFVIIMFYSGSGESAPARAKTITVREGVSLDYEPYGYKLPVETSEDILVNNLTTQEYNGLTLTRNADGSVRVQGTATANSNFHLYNDSHSATASSYQIIDNGVYYIGGGIEGNEEGKYYLSARYDDAEGGTPSRLMRIPYGENIRIDNSTGEYKYLSVYIAVWSGATVDFVCKPYLKAVSATNNIYLGNVQTTRYVRKSVLDGTEDWEIRQEGTDNAFFMLQTGDSAINHQIVATHYSQNNVSTTNTTTGIDVITQGHIRIRPSNASSMSVSDFESFLAQQYAVGTPVTVWYVLATETTGIVNEPLMKIGNYADTLSNATAIPTTEGANSITVDTTVQPSEFAATWTGWHNANVKEWDGSQWNQ